MRNYSFDVICCLLSGKKNNLLRQFTFVGLLFLMPLCFAVVANAQPDFASFLSRSDFNAVSSNLSIIDFESVAPAKGGFGKYSVNEGLTVNRAGFRTSGGGKFGAGMILVLSGPYAVTNPMYNTGTGAVLAWGPPNQPGNAYLDVMLPSGVFAVGVDLWTGQPYISTVEVIATTRDGKTQSVTVNTQQRPNSSFAGFVSDKEITFVRFQLPKGQSWLFLDNFSYGRKAEGANLKPSTSATVQQSDNKQNVNQAETPTARPSISLENPSQKSSVVQSDAPRQQTNNPSSTSSKNGVSASAAGNIAYVRGGTEIRLIAPDGTNDHRIWTHPDAKEELGLHELAWRPDGKELAFSSGHAAVTSLYDADLYAIKPDGTGFRKLTNPPDRSEFARFPKGTVTVTVSNSGATSDIFIIYVAGADEPQQANIPPGTAKTLVFKSVADFGNHPQAIVAMWGKYRWFMPGTDVQAGRTVKAPNFNIMGGGIQLLGAYRPVWRSDGSRVSSRSGLCVISSVPVNPIAGEYIFNPLFSGENPFGSCAWDWGPTPAVANQVIYTENSGEESAIFQITEGGKHPGRKLTAYSDLQYQLLEDLHWLPDGSGFLFSNVTLERDSANIFRYDFATKRTTQVTHLEIEFTGTFSVSPDGQWIVFERAKSRDDDKAVDLWMVGVDGKNLRLVVKDGHNPAWSR